MKMIFTFSLVCSLAQAVPLNDWNDYKTLHGKIYREDEDIHRMKVYLENLDKIAAHNAKYEQNLVGYKMGVNQFADMLAEEVAAQVNGFRPNKVQPRNECALPKVKALTSVDWRTKGAVTPVKNQGQCGSCWAFSTTGSLEGQNYLKNKRLVSLSEQNLVDCSGNYGNEGCDGGLMDQAFQYIKANGGLDTEQSYPYTGEDGACEFKKNDVGATDTGFCDIPQGDENALLQAVNGVGPISVAIDASQNSFQLYSGGVYDEPNCSSTQLDHGVLVVGYGTENGKDFWLVKNSWGADWGESGFIKMSRNANNQCGIATQASFPLV